jgi:DNA-binding XRE family transcriptional regulator
VTVRSVPATRKKARSYRSEARLSPKLQGALRKLGARVRELRQVCDFTQEELAGRAGLDPKHLQEIEAGKSNATMATVIGIADAVGISLTELFKGV